MACTISKLPFGTVIFEDVGAEFFRGQVLKPIDRATKYATDGDALNGRIKYRAEDRLDTSLLTFPVRLATSRYWMGSINYKFWALFHYLSGALLSLHLSNVKKFFYEILGNTVNQTGSRWVRSEFVIHCAMRPPYTSLPLSD